MKNNPLVTVIIPTYNRAYVLPMAINSVLAQDYENVQLIIADDGSKDNTREIVESFQHPKIEYYYQENKGQGAARNLGLQYAHGEFIATLDSDDLWYPTFLSEQIGELVKYDLDFTFVNYWHEQKGKDLISQLNHHSVTMHYFDESNPHKWIHLDSTAARKMFVTACACPSSGLVIRRKSMKGTWNSKMKIADDWNLQLDILLNKECKVAFNFKQLWFKRIDMNNVYDSRPVDQVFYLFGVLDYIHIIRLYRGKLTRKEKNILIHRHLRYLNSLVFMHLQRKNPVGVSKFVWIGLKHWPHKFVPLLSRTLASSGKRIVKQKLSARKKKAQLSLG